MLVVDAPAGAQNAAKAAPKGDAKAKAPTPQPAGGQGGAYPQRPRAAADILSRGQALYNAECGFCHGEDARGGDMGSNLIRSQVVLNDDQGERDKKDSWCRRKRSGHSSIDSAFWCTRNRQWPTPSLLLLYYPHRRRFSRDALLPSRPLQSLTTLHLSLLTPLLGPFPILTLSTNRMATCGP